MKQKRFVQRNQFTFTHFLSIPLIKQPHQQKLSNLQTDIHKMYNFDKSMEPNNPQLFHITLSMLTLANGTNKMKAQQIFQQYQDQILKLVSNKTVKIGGLGCFQQRPQHKEKIGKYEKLTIIYLDIIADQTLLDIADLLIREFIKQDIIDTNDLRSMKIKFDEGTKMFRPEKFHLTLFRIKESPIDFRELFQKYQEFNFGEVKITSVDISTRFEYDNEQFYQPLSRIEIMQN